MPLHRLTLLLVLWLGLAGCPREAAAPAGEAAGPAPATPATATATGKDEGAAVADATPAGEDAALSDTAARPAIDPAPPATQAETAKPSAPAGPATGSVDRRCSVDADCTIKDVGSCCGYRPACVNVDSPTFAKQVQAKCAEEGRVSTCGFPAISGCRCVEGSCAATGDGAAAVQ